MYPQNIHPKHLIPIILILLTFIACQKTPGEGGGATLIGNITTTIYQLDSLEQDGQITLQAIPVNTTPIAATKQQVYLIYGDQQGEGYDESTRTSYDGSYRFDNLRQGDYQIFTYSECLPEDCLTDTEAIQTTATITKNQEEITLSTLEIKEYN